MDLIKLRICFIKRKIDRLKKHIKDHPFDIGAQNRVEQLISIIGLRNENEYNLIVSQMR